MNKTLQELHLGNNLLNGYQDALQLGDLLRYNNTLHTLQLNNNVVADAGKLLNFDAQQTTSHKGWLTMIGWKWLYSYLQRITTIRQYSEE